MEGILVFLWLTFQSVSILFPVFKKSFKLVVKGGRKKVGRGVGGWLVGWLVGRLVGWLEGWFHVVHI